MSIQSGSTTVQGRTVNVSQQGALIESNDYPVTDDTTINITDASGKTVQGSIVNVRGNYLHVHFADETAWSVLQRGLEIPAPAHMSVK